MARVSKRAAFLRQFGRRLRQLREAHRPAMSLTALSVHAGISLPYASQLESGRRAPSLAAVLALAKALGAEPWELLLVGEEHPFAALGTAIKARDWEAVDMALCAAGMPSRTPPRVSGPG